MSNLQPQSVIACLDCPEHIEAVLDASMWVARRLSASIGLLHTSQTQHRKAAVDYSGCLNLDDGEDMLDHFTHEDHLTNSQQREQGRALLANASQYCKQKGFTGQTYVLHRHTTLVQSIDYVADAASMVVLGRKLTKSTTLDGLVRRSRCPVLLTYPQFVAPKSALFAFDNKPTCHHLLQWLCQSPLARTLHLHIVMVGKDTEQNRDAVREAYARLQQAGIHCKKALVDSRDVTAALAYYRQQHRLEMLISGAFGQSRLHEWLRGSDTQKLISRNQTPYLLYPHQQ